MALAAKGISTVKSFITELQKPNWPAEYFTVSCLHSDGSRRGRNRRTPSKF